MAPVGTFLYWATVGTVMTEVTDEELRMVVESGGPAAPLARAMLEYRGVQPDVEDETPTPHAD